MKLNLYSAFDKVGKRSICVFSCSSDGLAIRENAPALSKVIPLGDIDLYKIGELEDDSLTVSSCDKVLIDWNSYSFPENPLSKDK